MAATADEVLPRAKHGATNGRHRLLGAVPLYKLAATAIAIAGIAFIGTAANSVAAASYT